MNMKTEIIACDKIIKYCIIGMQYYSRCIVKPV